MNGYTKLFNSIITSTIWSEDDRTRIVWITLLACSDKNGEVQASIPGLARIAGVPVEDCRMAIAKFLGPDPDSRTKDDEGRRIQVIDGGWHIINHSKYRRMASDEDRRTQASERQKRFREKTKRNGEVTHSDAIVHDSSRQNSHTDTEANTESEERQTAVDLALALDSIPTPSKRSAVASPTTDEEWLRQLKSDPTYAGIDVDREFGKCAAWCQVNRKQPSRRRFINWLNGADRPIAKAHQASSTLSPSAQRLIEQGIDPVTGLSIKRA